MGGDKIDVLEFLAWLRRVGLAGIWCFGFETLLDDSNSVSEN